MDLRVHTQRTTRDATTKYHLAIKRNSAQLSPIATYEGQIVGRNIVEGSVAKPDYASIPSCGYTVPALASVGATQAKAGKAGKN
jgi:pyruvate/2-oxoglutarate dehydrogenase complex dihydrolipoamide dehydrogenase (E3) component